MKLKFFHLLLLSFYIVNCTFYIEAQATVRYVSKTGTSQPPYTSWETSADSIQKCINICGFGDTVYVANGIYKERIDMTPGLSLIGAGMDSCLIDTREFSPYYSVRVTDSCYFAGFQIASYSQTEGIGIVIYDVNIETINAIIENNRIADASNGIRITTSSLGFDSDYKLVRSNFIINVQDGIIIEQTNPLIIDNIIYPKEGGLGSNIISSPTYINNTIIMENGSNISYGYSPGFHLGSVLKDNSFYIYQGNVGIYSANDSVINNVVTGNPTYGMWTQSGGMVKNNIVKGANTGIEQIAGTTTIKYNNLWENNINYVNINPDTTNINVNPMFVNEDSLNLHLQMYSPLIDAGDPNILDKDGSRSDIGVFGGPYGEKYTYRDLAPKPPSNLTAEMDSGLVKLRWNKNSESDFYRYRVYRDTVPDFMYDTTKIIAVIPDTIYYDDPPQKYISGNYYYKITALDNTLHQSAPSEEVHVNITGIPEGPPIVIEHYRLLNNYPNPFNSSTIIPYRLKEGGYVKLYVYDVKGELVRVLVNGYQSAGFYEVRFSPTDSQRRQGNINMEWETGYNDDIASGIYIYQLMVKGDGDIPVFTDMHKMILLK